MEYGTTLSHHGILFQKWGERNGPPYPLRPGAHSAAEKRGAKSGISTLASYVSNRKKKYKKKKAIEKAKQTRIQNERIKYEKEHYDELKSKAYNAVVKVINAFDDEDTLPIIGEKHKTKDQRKSDKAKRKQEEEKYRSLKLTNDKKELELKKEKKKKKKDEEESS